MKIVYTAFLLLVLGACNLTHPCQDSNLILGFTGFPNSLGFDTVYLRAYVQNDSFNQLVDTERVVHKYAPRPLPGDTIYF